MTGTLLTALVLSVVTLALVTDVGALASWLLRASANGRAAR